MSNKKRPILKSKHDMKFLFNNRNYLLLLATTYLNIHLPSKQNPQYILQGSLDPIFRIIDVAKTFTSDMLPCHRYLLNVCNVICFAFIKLVEKSTPRVFEIQKNLVRYEAISGFFLKLWMVYGDLVSL